jgi:signal transduction histidine kinase
MRSLSLKLTLAFLVVGLTGAVLVAVILARQTQREFDRFVLQRYQGDIATRLINYYVVNGGWAGIENVNLMPPGPGYGGGRGVEGPRGGNQPDLFVLAAGDGEVIVAGRQHQAGKQLAEEELQDAVPLQVEGQTVGWVLFAQAPRRVGSLFGTLEQDFLQRMRVALVLGALGATLFALLLGILLARTIAQPVRELTGATRRMAQGELGVQVPVRANDELGELSASFNQMSSDLSRATQARRQMTADIAHDLRTPLSVILGYTEALSDGKLQATTEMYDVMHKEAGHLNHLVEDLRTLSLADAGELPLVRQNVPPLEILQRAAVAHSAQAEGQHVTLKVEGSADLPTLFVDPERLAQVLNNLLSNALRYTPAGGTITLSALGPTRRGDPPWSPGAENGRVQLRVADTGRGIPAEDLPQIFHRFYRGDLARRQDGSSGLGLAIARSIVEAHGGEITAASTVGQGSTFTITLPVGRAGSE